MKEDKINDNCPNCDSWKVFYNGRLGGVSGYSDMFTCVKCYTKFQVMYMGDKPVHKRIVRKSEE